MVKAQVAGSEPAEAYCSTHCEQAETVEEGEDICACGHPACDTP
jgi:hypothetical protein